MRIIIALALILGCSAHQRRIDTARSDGNEPLAMCFETCSPEDDGCAGTCESQHPTKWHHQFSPLVTTAKKVALTFAIAMHPLAVADARNGGNEALAACFEHCKPDDTSCMRTCDRTHARPIDHERRREMLALVAKVGVESYKQDRARRDAWAASNGASNDPRNRDHSSTSSGGDRSWGDRSSSGAGDRSSNGGSANSAGAEPQAGPPKNIHFGKSCNECDFNIKNGLACTIPAKATCGDGDLTSGAGFCVAQKTDTKGSCSARCTKNTDCPSGNTCANLGTGASVCVRG